VSKSGLNETSFEQSLAQMLLEICALFQVPSSLVFSRPKTADEFNKYMTALLFEGNGGWRGDRRPQAW